MQCHAPALSGMTPHRSPKLRSGLRLSGTPVCCLLLSTLQTVQKSLADASPLPGKTYFTAGTASSAFCLPRAHSGAAVQWGPTNPCGQSHFPISMTAPDPRVQLGCGHVQPPHLGAWRFQALDFAPCLPDKVLHTPRDCPLPSPP